MDSFIDQLEQLKKLNRDDALAQIFRFFKSINNMNRNDIIAAYQALKLFCEKQGKNSHEGDFAPIRTAIIGRMLTLCCDKNGLERLVLIKTFIRATNLSSVWFRGLIEE